MKYWRRGNDLREIVPEIVPEMKKAYSLQKRGAFWYVRFLEAGVEVKRSTGETTKAAAVAWAESRFTAPDAGITLGAWAAPFYGSDCPHVGRLREEGKNYSEKNRVALRSLLERMVLPDPIMGKPLVAVTRGDLLELRKRLVKRLGACRTVNVAMGLVRTMFSEAVYRQVLQASPASRIGQVAYHKKEVVVLTPDAIRAILAPERWGVEIYLQATIVAAFTGMRAGEVRGLTWGALDPAAGRIFIRQKMAIDGTALELPKWGKVRETAYPQSLQAILEPLRGPREALVFCWRGEGISYSWWAKAFRKAAAAAGAPHATLHGLRHSLHTLLRGAGLADDKLRGAFGWTGPAVQEGYTHRALYDLSEQSQAVDTILGGF